MLAPRWQPSAARGSESTSVNTLHEQSLPCGVSESALDAFTRISSRGTCCGLDILDKHEPHRVGLPRETILEILGDNASGKSMVLYNYAIDFILPKQFGGLGTPVIFADMGCTLEPLFLTEIMGRRIVNMRKLKTDENIEEYNQFIENHIKESMRRLHIMRAHSTTELAAELLSLSSDEPGTDCKPALSQIGAILIDDIATTVLQDKASQPFGGQNLWRAFTQLLSKLSAACGMSILYAKNSLFLQVREAQRYWYERNARYVCCSSKGSKFRSDGPWSIECHQRQALRRVLATGMGRE
eukprot:gb/GECG01011312.1/.p1 GENE.gb/GECG01011312.1/~~gb/GECG01011312.1/.p1  ORF type:complete len:298 (+),score=19.56 gb/GECG01011312.1/:1-894(+)